MHVACIFGSNYVDSYIRVVRNTNKAADVLSIALFRRFEDARLVTSTALVNEEIMSHSDARVYAFMLRG